jgi:BirA family biotin operon repressor/biotin-[acetyl-CoA-carboxylase] ligase
VRFKWPNDVLIDGAKVSGILMEATAGPGPAVEWVVIGIGVNVAHAPSDAGYPATSLHAAGAGAATVEVVLEKLAVALQAWLERWRRQGFAPVRQQWLAFARGVGEPVEVRLQRETLHGRFAALDEGGALLLALPGGATRSVTAGDVFFAGDAQ